MVECSRGNISLGKTLCEHKEMCSLFILIFVLFRRCVFVKIFADSGFLKGEEKRVWNVLKRMVFLKVIEIWLFFNRVFVLSEMGWYPQNPL